MSLGKVDVGSGLVMMPGVAMADPPPDRGRRRSLLLTVAALATMVLFAIAALLAGVSKAGASPTKSDGSLNCQACHSNPNFEILRLADGTHLALTESAPLCAQCHEQRYEAWVSGTHGFPGFMEGSPPGDASTMTTCTTCHNPHEPRIALKDITRPHPEPVAEPPAIPTDLVMILGISLAVVGGAFVLTLVGRGRQ